MEAVNIEMDAATAYKLYQAYQRDRHFETAIDKEIKRTYREIAKGHTVIKALESIVAAGAHEDGTPKLGLVRADQTRCIMSRDHDGGFTLSTPGFENKSVAAADMRFRFPSGSLPQQIDTSTGRSWWRPREAIVPLIPLHLRPRTGLDGYHILWEAEWNRTVPIDPFLLKRLGKGDLWLVVAAWDLTEVERAALQSRVRPS
jgi:hypothetical protein